MEDVQLLEGLTPAKAAAPTTEDMSDSGTLEKNNQDNSKQHTASTKAAEHEDALGQLDDLEKELEGLEEQALGFKEVRLFTECAKETEEEQTSYQKPDYRVQYLGIPHEFTKSNDCHFSHEEITLSTPGFEIFIAKCRKFLKGLQRQSQPLATQAEYQLGSSLLCTRQTTNTWFRLRRERITSSTFGRVIKRRKFDPAETMAKFVQNHMNPYSYQGDIDSLAYGKLLESSGVKKYIAHNPHMTVRETGMWTYGAQPWLGGSPDGLVTDTRTGQEGLLEIKCPLRGKNTTFAEMASQKGFYMEKQADGSYALSPKEEYYFQIQGCMELLNKEFCDFAVVTEKDLYVQRIPRERKFFQEQMLPKLHECYFRFFMPLQVRRSRLQPAKVPVVVPKPETKKEKGLGKRKAKAKPKKKAKKGTKGQKIDVDEEPDDAEDSFIEEVEKEAVAPPEPVEMKDVLEWKYTFLGKDLYDKYFKDLVFPLQKDPVLDVEIEEEEEDTFELTKEEPAAGTEDTSKMSEAKDEATEQEVQQPQETQPQISKAEDETHRNVVGS